MKSIFEEGVASEVKERINQLDTTSQAHWGKMDVGQMLYHCQLPLNIILEKNDYGLKPNWFAKTFFKKSMYSNKPWRKNLPTMPMFRITDARSFETEKQELLNLVNELESQRNRNDWKEHPSFGKLTKDQWGKMQYKHLDHHLRQFGV